MKCQTKARGQEKVFIICIKKFLSALVAGSFQVSAGLSWECEVFGGGGPRVTFTAKNPKKKIPRWFVLAGQAESQ